MVSVCLKSLEEQQSSHVGISSKVVPVGGSQISNESMLLVVGGARACCQ